MIRLKQFFAADKRRYAQMKSKGAPVTQQRSLPLSAFIRIYLRLNLLLSFVTFFSASAHAQTLASTKSLRVVVPFTAASATDTTARVVVERLSIQLGQTFVVENRPGAGGTIGVGVVAKAEPDGYTILVHSSSFTVTPSTYPDTPYNTQRDFAGITPLANLPNVLVIAPLSRGLRSVKELVAAAKAKPGALTYASAGAGSATQVERRTFPARRGIRGRSISRSKARPKRSLTF